MLSEEQLNGCIDAINHILKHYQIPTHEIIGVLEVAKFGFLMSNIDVFKFAKIIRRNKAEQEKKGEKLV